MCAGACGGWGAHSAGDEGYYVFEEEERDWRKDKWKKLRRGIKGCKKRKQKVKW